MRNLSVTFALVLATAGFSVSAEAAVPDKQVYTNDTDYCVNYEYLYDDTGYFDDGQMDLEEFGVIGDTYFSDWDTDGDGYVDETEFTTCYDSIGWDVGDTWSAYDVDGDGVLNDDEFFSDDAYDDLDADDDDFLGIDEWF